MTATEEAILAGVDLSLIELSLSYSYDKRAEQHQAALELALELERIGGELRGAAEFPHVRVRGEDRADDFPLVADASSAGR